MGVPSFQKAVVIEKTGGPEVMQYRQDYPVAEAKEGQVVVKNNISGVNFIDIYFREGLYSSSKPEVLGREASGTVVALGPKTKTYGLNIGDRVIWLGAGGYAEYSTVPAEKVIRIPSEIPDEIITAAFMSGLTCLALSREAYEVKAGDWVLLHAAAGGAGFLMTQILKKRGAFVIGTAGGSEKAALVESLGADYVIDYKSPGGQNWPEIVLGITSGRGVDVVFDSVGKDTWHGSLKSVKRKGTIIWFGNASGPVPPFSLGLLSPKCVKIARPTLLGYLDTRQEFESYAQELFDLILKEKLKVNIHKIYSLKEVQQAHKDLEGRKSTGKLLLCLTKDSFTL